ncbi:MAG: hypothetical protein COB29_15845 [Sulfitobacter sp.]|nr:MAG: hypothetical protein COB29_15845 [Sulfitobacter sp.]
MQQNKLFFSGILLTLGNASGAILGFLRNIVIARLISVEDFGIAATFAIALQIIEMSSNLAIDRLLIQSKDGDQADLQSTAQALQFLRGLFGTTVMFLASGLIANLFGLPHLTWAFQLLSLVHLANSFAHFDITRFQRKLRFGPKAIQDVLPQLLTFLLAAPLAFYFADYRAVLCIIMIQVSLGVLLSHVLAQRKYEWSWNQAHIKTIFSFGWPLFLNTFLMIGIFQADRFIVGSVFNMETLGWFSAAFTLTLVPSTLLAKVLQSFFLPILSKHQSHPANFQYISIAMILILVIAGFATAVGFSVAGPSIFLLIFGEKFAAGAPIIALLGLMQGIRVAKEGPIIIALAKAKTKMPMATNMVRGIWIIAALASAVIYQDIKMLVWCGILAEFSALIYAFYYISNYNLARVKNIFLPSISSLVGTLIIFYLASNNISGMKPIQEIAITIFILVIFIPLFFYLNPIILRMFKIQGKKFDKF